MTANPQLCIFRGNAENAQFCTVEFRRSIPIIPCRYSLKIDFEKYGETLSQAQDALSRLYHFAHGKKRITLLFASKNVEQNNATVLKELLDGKRKPPTGTGPGAVHAMRKRAVAPRR